MKTLPAVKSPTDFFKCDHFHGCRMMARACVLRQGKRYTLRTGGGRSNKVAKEQRVALEFAYCAGGECAQGKKIAAALKGQEIEQPKVVDLRAQHAARRKIQLSAALLTIAAPEEMRIEKTAVREEEPSAPPAVCKSDGCSTPLRVNNLGGLCRACRNKVTSRQRAKLIPVVARAAGTAGNALAADSAAPAPAPSLPPAPARVRAASPLAEDPAAWFPKEKRLCAGEGCGKTLGARTKGDKCVLCLKKVKPGGGWASCANKPACERMTQKLVNRLCALCRQGKKYHLVNQGQQKREPPIHDPKKCDWTEEPCTKELRADNESGLCKRHHLVKDSRERRVVERASRPARQCSTKGCDTSLNGNNKTGRCRDCTLKLGRVRNGGAIRLAARLNVSLLPDQQLSDLMSKVLEESKKRLASDLARHKAADPEFFERYRRTVVGG